MRRFDLQEIDSTNNQARRLAVEYPGEPILVTAVTQTAGRGRNGRVWQSPAGGAWFSVAWPVRGSSNGSSFSRAPLAAAVAVRRALVELAPQLDQRLLIKWPNDLLVDDRKLVGILCEQTAAGGVPPQTLILGVGVNVDFGATALAAPLRRPAITLREASGRVFAPAQVIDSAAPHLESALGALDAGEVAPIIAELRQHLAHFGQRQSWQVGADERTGVICGVDDSGRLILDGDEERWALAGGELIEPVG